MLMFLLVRGVGFQSVYVVYCFALLFEFSVVLVLVLYVVCHFKIL